jgi:hypothetical protein
MDKYMGSATPRGFPLERLPLELWDVVKLANDSLFFKGPITT